MDNDERRLILIEADWLSTVRVTADGGLEKNGKTNEEEGGCSECMCVFRGDEMPGGNYLVAQDRFLSLTVDNFFIITMEYELCCPLNLTK